MQLILFRHGIAEERRPDLDDADRRLTTLGIERTRLAARGLASLYSAIDRILTSPKLRALETAQLLGEAVGKPVEVCEPLAEEDLEAMIGVVQDLDDRATVFVGHEPMLSILAQQLCGGQNGVEIYLKKAGAVVIELEDLQTVGILEALLPPKVLRALA